MASGNQIAVSLRSFPWQTSALARLLEQHRAKKMAHAYLVSGEQGIGKFELIQAFAIYLQCRQPTGDSACGHCVNCNLSASGSHPDIMIIQPEASSRDIKVDQIRALSEFVSRTSHAGLMKFIIINHAHNLNISAANSLLKTLEEPSADTFLFLITERADSLPATLRSRCQRLLIQTPTLEEATNWLRQQGMVPEQAALLAAAAGKRPLHAMSLAEADGIANAEEYLHALLAVVQQKTTPQSAVSVALKIGDAVAVEYLLRTSSIVIRGLLIADSEQDDLHREILRTLSTIANRESLIRRLLNFNLAAEKALRQLQGSTNPNPQLLLESMIWQWSILARTA